MKIYINKRSYARGVLPWCPYVGGFWRNLFAGHSSFCCMGYRVDVKREASPC